MDKAGMEAERIRMLRGIVLRAAYEVYPRPLFGAMMRWAIEEVGASDEDVERQLNYLNQRGWIVFREVVILGRSDQRIELTADGVDVAVKIDPKNPVLC